MNIEIFSKNGCIYCDRARTKLQSMGMEFNERKLGIDASRDELLERVPNAKTVPQIFIDGEIVGGYEDLEEFLSKQDYNE